MLSSNQYLFSKLPRYGILTCLSSNNIRFQLFFAWVLKFSIAKKPLTSSQSRHLSNFVARSPGVLLFLCFTRIDTKNIFWIKISWGLWFGLFGGWYVGEWPSWRTSHRLYLFTSICSSFSTSKLVKHLNLALDLLGDRRSSLDSCMRDRYTIKIHPHSKSTRI